jgi:hypothetical protein
MGIKESTFNREFRMELTPLGWKFDRIESHATAPGIPDDACVHTASRLSGWVEVKEEQTIPHKVKYRPRQSWWLEDHVDRGGNALTVIHIKSTDSILFIPGSCSVDAEFDLHELMRRKKLYHVPLSLGWPKISAILLSHFTR